MHSISCIFGVESAILARIFSGFRKLQNNGAPLALRAGLRQQGGGFLFIFFPRVGTRRFAPGLRQGSSPVLPNLSRHASGVLVVLSVLSVLCGEGFLNLLFGPALANC